MKKIQKEQFEKWCRENNVDDRTLPLIISHYLSLGENTIGGVTPDDIQEMYEREMAREKEAERRGKIYMIAPDFSKYLIECCVSLYKLDSVLRYKIISEVLK